MYHGVLEVSVSEQLESRTFKQLQLLLDALTGWITEGDAFQDVHVTDTKFFWDTIYFNHRKESQVDITSYEEYQRKIWDASEYIGEELYIKVVDQSTGGFRHINVDDFNVPVKLQNPSSQ